MQADDRSRFKDLLTDALAFYRRDVSTFALSVWWQACAPYQFEQVAKALTAHAMDPERGQFAPMPADIVRLLQGTSTDRSLLAWGKTLDAMQHVGAYASVCFDDPAIHAAVDDLGGWPKLCRSTMDELPFVQRRFCDAHKAYAARGHFDYPARLCGETEQANAVGGYSTPPVVLIGDPEQALKVGTAGSLIPKTKITRIGQAMSVRRIAGSEA